ncbi:MAG: efflux transporter outer membrane subunit [Desulfobulbaceae bacterium]|nr:efflux transporter outer membrane subunit [Desulfobulbaceae bacterium]
MSRSLPDFSSREKENHLRILKNILPTFTLSTASNFPKNRPGQTKTFAGFLLLFALLSAACTPFTPQARTSDQLGLPAAYSLAAAVADPQQQWWQSFGDQQLNQLIIEALANNLSLQTYWARLDQSRAAAIKAGADGLPTLTGEAGAAGSRARRTTDSATSSSGSQNFSAGVVAAYELDLWGRVRASRAAADLAATASREDLNAAAVTMVAEITNRWARIITQQRQKDLLGRQLATSLTYLELIELRFRKSLASALDVFQQRQVVDKLRAQLPLVEQQQQLLSQELALLLGRLPQAAPKIMRRNLPEPGNLPPLGLPADLLAARPDIQAAGRRLAAADHSFAAARADRLPALRLTGSASLDHDRLDGLLDNWLLNLAASLTAPLIDGGRRQAEVLRSEAKVRELLALYRQTVLLAIKEVEAALVNENKIKAHNQALQQQLATAQKALTEARSRYLRGLNDYLPVLTQLQTVQALEKEAISQQSSLLLARIDLHRALGAAWTAELAPPALGHNSE